MNSTPPTLAKVIEVVSSVLKMSPADVTVETAMGNTAKWDSMNHLHILTELEAEFDCMFDLDEISQVRSVGDWVALIEKQKNL